MSGTVIGFRRNVSETECVLRMFLEHRTFRERALFGTECIAGVSGTECVFRMCLRQSVFRECGWNRGSAVLSARSFVGGVRRVAMDAHKGDDSVMGSNGCREYSWKQGVPRMYLELSVDPGVRECQSACVSGPGLLTLISRHFMWRCVGG